MAYFLLESASPSNKTVGLLRGRPTMPGVLSAPQMEAFEREGYVLVRPPFSEHE
eukprot:COSAG03_NODE_4706_length_1460_cov_1.457017_2_plen_53_part_01